MRVLACTKVFPMPINDNSFPTGGATPLLPDPHGQAALLLVESLIHVLMERSVISISDAIEIVETADDVQVDVAKAADGHGAPMWRSHALLTAILESLKGNDPGGSTTPSPTE